MTTFDDNSFPPPPPPASDPSQPLDPSPAAPELSGDPLSYIPVEPPAPPDPQADLPEDLRISWTWVHLLCFIIFAFVSMTVVQLVFAAYYAPHKPMPGNDLEQYLFSIPQFVVGTTLVSFVLLILFLYFTLAALPGKPFWHTLGWRKWKLGPTSLPKKPWIYILAGCSLSVLTAFVGSRVKTPDDMPIEMLLKNKTGLILMMSMAVLVAPLVEETIFRGYLYPVFVRIIAAILRYFGFESAAAARSGIVSSVLLTGLLFGLLHGSQLSWTWGIVSLLIFVGITFTYVRARTGTVFASFLMHLGYNSLIALATIAASHGFTKIPPHP
jgi:membrane protease YdiL (CAAX protease family)